MEIKNRETTRNRAAVLFGGGDNRNGLDLVDAHKYASEDEYLDAAAKAELERQSPEFRNARARLKREFEERKEQQMREENKQEMKKTLANVTLSEYDISRIDKEARELAYRDLSAGRIWADELGRAIERHTKELTEKRKNEKARNSVMSAMIRRSV